MEPHRRFALIIACAEFNDARIHPLPGAGVDGLRVRNFALDNQRGAFAVDNTRLLASPSINEVKNAIGDLFADAKAQDGLALLYVATHGYTDGSTGLLLAMRDASLDRRATSMLSVRSIAECIAEHRPRRTVTVLDVCSAGGLATGTATIATDKLWADLQRMPDAALEGHFLIAACGTQELSGEYSDGGIFTSVFRDSIVKLGEKRLELPWLSAEAIAQQAVHEAAQHDIGQRPEWTGIAVAIDVPLCRNPSHDPSYIPPHTGFSSSSTSETERKVLHSCIREHWAALNLIGSGKLWYRRAVGAARQILDDNVSRTAKVRFVIQSLQSIGQRVERCGEDNDRLQLLQYLEEGLVILGAEGAHTGSEMEVVIELQSRLGSWLEEYLSSWSDNRGWLVDGPAAVVLSPIRFWDVLGTTSLFAVGCRSHDRAQSDSLLAKVADVVDANPKLHRIVWQGQYPDIALAIGTVLPRSPNIAKTCSLALLERLCEDYERSLFPEGVAAPPRELGRLLAMRVIDPKPSRIRYADEGPALCLGQLIEAGTPELEMNTYAAKISESEELNELVLYQPKTISAQFREQMNDIDTLSWPGNEEGVTRFLREYDDFSLVPFDRSASSLKEDILASAAAGRVFRNRAVYSLSRAIKMFFESE